MLANESVLIVFAAVSCDIFLAHSNHFDIRNIRFCNELVTRDTVFHFSPTPRMMYDRLSSPL